MKVSHLCDTSAANYDPLLHLSCSWLEPDGSWWMVVVDDDGTAYTIEEGAYQELLAA